MPPSDFGCVVDALWLEAILFAVFLAIGACRMFFPAPRFWSFWRLPTLVLSSMVIMSLFSARPVDLSKEPPLVIARTTAPTGADLIEIELKKANDEIQFRIQQEDTWFHVKFLLVGGMLAGFFAVVRPGKISHTRLVAVVSSRGTCFILALACIVALAIDIHLRNNIIVIQQLALWITHYVEPALAPAGVGFLPWEKFLRTPGAGMHSDEIYGLLFYPHLHFLTWVLYMLYLTCFHWIVLKTKGEKSVTANHVLLLGGFAFVHIAVATFAFVGHFVPRTLTMNVLPGGKCWQTGASAAVVYLVAALLLVAINSPYLLPRWKRTRTKNRAAATGLVIALGAGMFAPHAVEAQQPRDRAVAYLERIMDQFHETYDVYTDVASAGNHFPVRARMSNYDNTCRPDDAMRTVPPMDEAWTIHPHSGPTCIRASFRSEILDGELNWAAWYFMNGMQRDPTRPAPPRREKCANARPVTKSAPEANWGDQPDAGIDLTGATRLTFHARGEKGGERVEFFALGVGWNPDDVDPKTRLARPQRGMQHRDSSRKVSTGFITLSPQWTRYQIDLRGRDLHYVLGGFGWAASTAENGPDKELVFYLDDIRYELDPSARSRRLDQARFLVSYQAGTGTAFDRVMRNTAYTYDNALALLAFLSVGDMRRARVIADAFLLAESRDRFLPPDPRRARMYEGAVRNAYQAGDLLLPPGWITGRGAQSARIPGWYEDGDRSPCIVAADIKHATRFAVRLREDTDSLSVRIRRRLTPAVLQDLAKGPACEPEVETERRQRLADELNRLAADGLDRHVLEAAYPDELERAGEGWLEDSYVVSLDSGNIAWAMLALLAYHERSREPQYLAAAIRMGEWVVRNGECDCQHRDGLGYTGGWSGFEPEPVRACYKSTEHNIDLYAAFARLGRVTGNPFWNERAENARKFVQTMWCEGEGMFWTGTTPEGRINQDVVPLDVQAWAVLSLKNALTESQRARALEYAERHMRLTGGYDYSRRACANEAAVCRDREGIWYEGTAQMATVYRVRGDTARADAILHLLRAAQRDSGALPASDRIEGLATGFQHNDDCIRYYERAHVGATAWFILAEGGFNPYWPD